MSVAGDMTGNIEHVFYGEVAAEQRTRRAALGSDIVMMTERVERIVDAHVA
jgi:hypothetical protein